jgi:hypothetical protein
MHCAFTHPTPRELLRIGGASSDVDAKASMQGRRCSRTHAFPCAPNREMVLAARDAGPVHEADHACQSNV